METLIYIYIASFLFIYSANNSYHVLFLGNPPLIINTFDKQIQTNKLIYKHKDLLSAYYYEISISIISLFVYFILIKNNDTLSTFENVILIFAISVSLISAFIQYNKFHITYMLDSLNTCIPYNLYIKNTKDSFSISFDYTSTIELNNQELIRKDCLSYKEYLNFIEINSLEPLSESEYLKYRSISNDSVVFKYKREFFMIDIHSDIAYKIKITETPFYDKMNSYQYTRLVILERVFEASVFSFIYFIFIIGVF